MAEMKMGTNDTPGGRMNVCFCCGTQECATFELIDRLRRDIREFKSEIQVLEAELEQGQGAAALEYARSRGWVGPIGWDMDGPAYPRSVTRADRVHELEAALRQIARSLGNGDTAVALELARAAVRK